MKTIRVRRSHGLLAALALLAAGACMTPATSSAYVAKITGSSNTAASNPYFTCAAVFAAYPQSATYFEYALNEANNAAFAVDDSGVNSRRGTYRGTMTTSTVAPLPCDDFAGGAYVANGTNSWISTAAAVANPTTLTIAIWVKTTTAQGAVVGFANSSTGTPTAYDRVLYLTTAGRVAFGIYNNQTQVITSSTAITDGEWHFIAASLSPTSGTALYVDGLLVASSTAYVTAQNYTGYWRIGNGDMTSWPGGAQTAYFRGSLRSAAVYRSALSATEVMAMYVAGR